MRYVNILKLRAIQFKWDFGVLGIDIFDSRGIHLSTLCQLFKTLMIHSYIIKYEAQFCDDVYLLALRENIAIHTKRK
jgi:hypothetical protein